MRLADEPTRLDATDKDSLKAASVAAAAIFQNYSVMKFNRFSEKPYQLVRDSHSRNVGLSVLGSGLNRSPQHLSQGAKMECGMERDFIEVVVPHYLHLDP